MKENNFSKNLPKLRKALGLTQEKFAKYIGVKRCRLGAWEEGRSLPYTDLFFKIADFFSVNERELLYKELTEDDIKSIVKKIG